MRQLVEWSGKLAGLLLATALTSLTMFSALHAQDLVEVTWSAEHTFSINDVQGGFNGLTFAEDQSFICGVPATADSPGSDACPPDAMQPVVDKSGLTLYPIDSEFGFIVSDFVGAADKTHDYDFAEGWVASIYESGQLVGLAISNNATDTFKVPAKMGTWCAGLGGNSLKCSTEHYSVLEHVLTCNETIPYKYADALTGDQADLIDPETGLAIPDASCADGKLGNDNYIVRDGVVTAEILTDPTPGAQMNANESSVREDIAVGEDYSVTLKDDGKALYRWGNMVKRPNDIRMYAAFALPDEWKANPDIPYQVVSATLTVEHLITNNPNDQLRPEDMENEAATGRLPGYTEFGDYWLSDRDCFEGDGDEIIEGTVFRNGPFAVPDGSTDPYVFSADLANGLTNGWYTTIDRDPFEPAETGGGPRWRLKANKFGQDIPGLEIPLQECSPVPFTSANIKYDVGEPTVTVINLLDWEEGVSSPLATSQGWLDESFNPNNEIDPVTGVSINGLPLTPDFDLGVYVKGDRKATAIYNAVLDIVYLGSGDPNPPPGDAVDLALSDFRAPSKAKFGDMRKLRAIVQNVGEELSDGTLYVIGTVADVVVAEFESDLDLLAPGDTQKVVFNWTALTPGTVNWTATVVAPDDLNPANDVLFDSTIVR
ncbi:MAG: hypothetical protein PVG76_10380 [Chromatiales bacterium]|jgi:hypothetical protein